MSQAQPRPEELDPEVLEELQETFDHFDADGNGHIDLDEFRRLLDALGARGSETEMRIGFASIDGDHNGTIEFQEFLQWWQEI